MRYSFNIPRSSGKVELKDPYPARTPTAKLPELPFYGGMSGFKAFPQLPIEFPPILAYAKDADEFVRLSCRERTGWRRDEWAYSPLFICGKFPGF
jgi:hypothetical protein